MAERFGEREKEQKKMNCWGEQKVQSIMLLVFNPDHKAPQHPHLPGFIEQNRDAGWEINSKSPNHCAEMWRPRASFMCQGLPVFC